MFRQHGFRLEVFQISAQMIFNENVFFNRSNVVVDFVQITFRTVLRDTLLALGHAVEGVAVWAGPRGQLAAIVVDSCNKIVTNMV